MTDVNTSDGAVLEALNSKVDLDLNNLPGNIDYVVETYTDSSGGGGYWYRLYKSGWIEQGGTDTAKTLTFPIVFKDTNYSLVAIPVRMNPNVGSNDINYTGKQPESIAIQLRFGGSAQDSNYAYMWHACGYRK